MRELSQAGQAHGRSRRDHLTGRASYWRPRKKILHASRGSWQQGSLEHTSVPWCIVRVDFSVSTSGSGPSVNRGVTGCLSDVLGGLWLPEGFGFQGAVQLSRSTIKAVFKSPVVGCVQRLRGSQVATNSPA